MADQKEEPRFVDTISCHAWNADRTKVALCPGNNQVLIYAIKGGDLAQRTLEATLEEVWAGRLLHCPRSLIRDLPSSCTVLFKYLIVGSSPFLCFSFGRRSTTRSSRRWTGAR
jgi:hypothetical protein